MRAVCSREGELEFEESYLNFRLLRINYTLCFVCADISRVYFFHLLLFYKCRIESVLNTRGVSVQRSVEKGR